ncbi:MAG: CoA-binding protein [Deltaproteobacteria bacterium]
MESLIDRILAEVHTVAVVGLSEKPDRPSHGVARYLQERGFRVIPVNPKLREVLGETAYPSLREVPGKVDLVDVFRRPEEVPPIAEDAIRIGASYFWMQEGVRHREAEEMLAGAGIPVVADRCIKKELAKRGR